MRVTPAVEESDTVAHGLSYQVPFLVQAGDWRHGGALGMVQFLRPPDVAGFATYRVRMASFGEDGWGHLMVAGGGQYTLEFGPGTRGELIFLIGRLGKAGLTLSVVHGYYPEPAYHSVGMSLAAFIPYVFK